MWNGNRNLKEAVETVKKIVADTDKTLTSTFRPSLKERIEENGWGGLYRTRGINRKERRFRLAEKDRELRKLNERILSLTTKDKNSIIA